MKKYFRVETKTKSMTCKELYIKISLIYASKSLVKLFIPTASKGIAFLLCIFKTFKSFYVTLKITKSVLALL